MLSRVYYQRETVWIERGGKTVCQISPVPQASDFTLAQLIELMGDLPEADKELADAVRAGVEEQGDFEGLVWPRSSSRASSSR